MPLLILASLLMKRKSSKYVKIVAIKLCNAREIVFPSRKNEKCQVGERRTKQG